MILSIQLPKTYYKAMKYLSKAHLIGMWFCIAVIALILIISFALLYEQSNRNGSVDRRISAGVIFLLVFTFCWFGFNEHNDVNAYRYNIRQTQVYNKKKIKHSSNNKEKHVLKSRNKKYNKWLSLTHM